MLKAEGNFDDLAYYGSDFLDLLDMTRRYHKKFVQNPTDARRFWGCYVHDEFDLRGYDVQSFEGLSWMVDCFLKQNEPTAIVEGA